MVDLCHTYQLDPSLAVSRTVAHVSATLHLSVVTCARQGYSRWTREKVKARIKAEDMADFPEEIFRPSMNS
jgi:hypothetical protein